MANKVLSAVDGNTCMCGSRIFSGVGGPGTTARKAVWTTFFFRGGGSWHDGQKSSLDNVFFVLLFCCCFLFFSPFPKIQKGASIFQGVQLFPGGLNANF